MEKVNRKAMERAAGDALVTVWELAWGMEPEPEEAWASALVALSALSLASAAAEAKAQEIQGLVLAQAWELQAKLGAALAESGEAQE